MLLIMSSRSSSSSSSLFYSYTIKYAIGSLKWISGNFYKEAESFSLHVRLKLFAKSGAHLERLLHTVYMF